MDFDYYSGKDLTLPKHPKRPALAAKHTSQEALAYSEALVDFESAMVNFHAEISDYNTKAMAREQELKDTLRNDYDLNEKQFNLLWNFAWEEQRSGGLQRVVELFNEYYDLTSSFVRLGDRN